MKEENPFNENEHFNGSVSYRQYVINLLMSIDLNGSARVDGFGKKEKTIRSTINTCAKKISLEVKVKKSKSEGSMWVKVTGVC